MADKFEDVPNLYLLTKCDMACRFCYASKDLGRMPKARAMGVVDAFRRRGATHINITGGEALLHPDALEIVAYAHQVGMQITLFTSGSLYHERRVVAFSPYLSWLALSLDGDETLNVAMGRIPKHYAKALEAIELTRLHAPTVRIRVATVVTRINVDGLRSLAMVLASERYKPDLWRLKQMVPTRRAAENEGELAVDDDVFAAAMSKLSSEFGSRIRMHVHPNSAKIADTMCVHPDGSATVTVRAGRGMKILELGSMFADSDGVIDRWLVTRDETNARDYRDAWQPA
ncbi:MAG TPA: radical SAM protein [Gemmatimonadaceae bacterium]